MTNEYDAEETTEKVADEEENVTTENVVPRTLSDTEEVDVAVGFEVPLFTGDLGGHVLLDSSTETYGGALMGSALGTPANGIPGASQFAALVGKSIG
jgi:hypothetical protein